MICLTACIPSFPDQVPADLGELEVRCSETVEEGKPYRWCAEIVYLAFLNCRPEEKAFLFVERMNELGEGDREERRRVLEEVGCQTDHLPVLWSDEDLQAVTEYCLTLDRQPTGGCQRFIVAMQDSGRSVQATYCMFERGPKYETAECAPYR